MPANAESPHEKKWIDSQPETVQLRAKLRAKYAELRERKERGVMPRDHDDVMVHFIDVAPTPPTTVEVMRALTMSRNLKSAYIRDAVERGLIERKHPSGVPGNIKLCYLTELGQALADKYW